VDEIEGIIEPTQHYQAQEPVIPWEPISTDNVDTSAKVLAEVREMHKLYHNEFAGRLQSMQAELEQYREAEKGRAFDVVLGEIAKLYCIYEPLLALLEDGANDAVRKQTRYLFLDIEEILEAHRVCKQKSSPGDKRHTKFCKVTERIPTSDPVLHDTVVRSLSTGFYIDNRPLVKEQVDIYFLDQTQLQGGEQ
jgi:molecular chaperone GrpE (heat shock protein)